MRHSKQSIFLTFFVALATLVAVPAFAAQSAAGTLVSWDLDADTMTLRSAEGEMSYTLEADLKAPEALEKGDKVVVRYNSDKTVTRILPLHDSMIVEGELVDGVFGAVAGEVESATPNGMTIATVDGKEAFVIDSEELFPPLPRPGERVAVLYRTEPATGRDNVIAYDLAKLSEQDQVAISDEPMKQTRRDEKAMRSETMTKSETATMAQTSTDSQATTDAQSTWDETENQGDSRAASQPTYSQSTTSEQSRTASLPQTASQLQGLALLGLLSLIVGLGVRFLR